MAAPPVECNNSCHAKRVHLYMFYSTFLGALLLLALIHLVFFLSSRRRTKYEAREYATRKLEFVTLGIADLLPPNEKENSGEEINSTTENESHQQDVNRDRNNAIMSPEPSTSSSTSALNRILSINGNGSFPLQRIDEESAATMAQEALSTNKVHYSSSNIRGDRTMIAGALQEPVIVTVATVSALFQQHDIHNPIEQQSRSHSSDSMSSVIDISDLVNSPGRSYDGRNDESGEEIVGDWNAGVVERDGGFHAKNQKMLDVRIGGGGGKGGFLKSHRGDQLRKEDLLSTDAIFAMNESGSVYDTDHID